MSRHFDRQLAAEKALTEQINHIMSDCVRDRWTHEKYRAAITEKVYKSPKMAILTAKNQEYISGYLKAASVFGFHQKHVYGYVMDDTFYQCRTNHGKNQEITERRIPICCVWVDTVNGTDTENLKYWHCAESDKD